jgi:predicted GNAT family acetyltransferase
MPTGTPIRLVREDGELIELNATQIALSTERTFGPKAVPFMQSERVAIDLNINNASIRIDGFFSDDTQASVATSAQARINFNLTNEGKTFCTTNNLGNMFALNDDNFAGSRVLALSSSSSTDITMSRETTSSATSYNSSTDVFKIQTTVTNAVTTAQGIASALVTAINDQHSSTFTASLYDAVDIDGNIQSNTGVLIVNDTAGRAGNSPFLPVLLSGRQGPAFRPPNTQFFSGGADAVTKSAGDKVQEIYSIINNSSINTTKQISETAIFKSFLEHVVSPFATSMGTTIQDSSELNFTDYIVGIQIPFNSKITAGSNEYTAKNFFMATTISGKDDKDSTNNLAAGTVFSRSNQYTGIQGGLKSMDIVYDAGEAIYNYTMTFLPSDRML